MYDLLSSAPCSIEDPRSDRTPSSFFDQTTVMCKKTKNTSSFHDSKHPIGLLPKLAQIRPDRSICTCGIWVNYFLSGSGCMLTSSANNDIAMKSTFDGMDYYDPSGTRIVPCDFSLFEWKIDA